MRPVGEGDLIALFKGLYKFKAYLTCRGCSGKGNYGRRGLLTPDTPETAPERILGAARGWCVLTYAESLTRLDLFWVGVSGCAR